MNDSATCCNMSFHLNCLGHASARVLNFGYWDGMHADKRGCQRPAERVLDRHSSPLNHAEASSRIPTYSRSTCTIESQGYGLNCGIYVFCRSMARPLFLGGQVVRDCAPCDPKRSSPPAVAARLRSPPSGAKRSFRWSTASSRVLRSSRCQVPGHPQSRRAGIEAATHRKGAARSRETPRRLRPQSQMLG